VVQLDLVIFALLMTWRQYMASTSDTADPEDREGQQEKNHADRARAQKGTGGHPLEEGDLGICGWAPYLIPTPHGSDWVECVPCLTATSNSI
jgi:hypothetical protein